MSTENLRQVVEYVVKTHRHWDVPKQAVKELEAIERAALEFSRADQIPSALQRSYDLMRSIAREAK